MRLLISMNRRTGQGRFIKIDRRKAADFNEFAVYLFIQFPKDIYLVLNYFCLPFGWPPLDYLVRNCQVAYLYSNPKEFYFQFFSVNLSRTPRLSGGFLIQKTSRFSSTCFFHFIQYPLRLPFHPLSFRLNPDIPLRHVPNCRCRRLRGYRYSNLPRHTLWECPNIPSERCSGYS